MFIAGLHHLDRTRGVGWLDCPNCHEHAAQDVVDDMTFLQLLFFRFSPVARKRVLVCRRCGHRRQATAEELQHLETAGTVIHRAVMVPMGLLGLGVIAGIVGLIAWVGQSSANALANEKIVLIDQTGQAVPVNFKGPASWNYNPETDPVPTMKVSDAGGRMYFVIKRVTDGNTLEQLLEAHFDDEVGLTTTGFPSKPPKAEKASVGGQNAIAVTITYFQGAERDQQQIFVAAHNGVGYVVTYVALGEDAIKTMTTVAEEVNKSIRFSAPSETPPPSQSPSPGASASPGESPSPTRSP
jgi:hypothetical protein